MSTATFGSSGRTGGRRNSAPGGVGGWFAVIAVVGVLALLGLAVAWLCGWIRFGSDPRVVELRQLQEQARAAFASGGPGTMAEATATLAMMQEIRQKTEALPPELREREERQGNRIMGSLFRKRIDDYFAASPAERRALIDRQIDQEELMRKVSEVGSQVAGAFAPRRDGGAASGGGVSGPPGGPARGTDESRNRFLKSIIDRTRPEDRARYVEYGRAVAERREQRGLPASGWQR